MTSRFNQEYVDVPLTSTEIMVCTYIGKLRNHITSQHAQDRKQDKTLDGIQISINGVITEYAVSKFLKLPFDLNCDFRKFGADLITRKGKTIDVKCASKIGGNLNAVGWSIKKPVDLFVLTEIHTNCVRMVGWIYSQDFLTENNKMDVGNGEYYTVNQTELIPFEVIL
jgi:hypothetical protein